MKVFEEDEYAEPAALQMEIFWRRKQKPSLTGFWKLLEEKKTNEGSPFHESGEEKSPQSRIDNDHQSLDIFENPFNEENSEFSGIDDSRAGYLSYPLEEEKRHEFSLGVTERSSRKSDNESYKY